MAASHYIALVFGLLFIVAGFVKLLPLDQEQKGHGLPEMNKDFERFITVLPLRDTLGIKTVPMYISLVGAVELLLGAMLAFGRPSYQVFAAVPLLGMMIGAAYTLITLGDPLPMTIPACVFGSAMVYILMNPKGLAGGVITKSKSN